MSLEIQAQDSCTTSVTKQMLADAGKIVNCSLLVTGICCGCCGSAERLPSSTMTACNEWVKNKFHNIGGRVYSFLPLL